MTCRYENRALSLIEGLKDQLGIILHQHHIPRDFLFRTFYIYLLCVYMYKGEDATVCGGQGAAFWFSPFLYVGSGDRTQTSASGQLYSCVSKRQRENSVCETDAS